MAQSQAFQRSEVRLDRFRGRQCVFVCTLVENWGLDGLNTTLHRSVVALLKCFRRRSSKRIENPIRKQDRTVFPMRWTATISDGSNISARANLATTYFFE